MAGKFADSREKRKSRKRLRRDSLPINEKEAGPQGARPLSKFVSTD
jgi:hypothetical protein